MSGLLTYPEIQSGAIPFVIALVVVLVFKSNKYALVGVGVVLGFIVTAVLLNGFVFLPINGTRKIILTGIGALCLAGVFEFYFQTWRYRLQVFVVVGVSAFFFMAWPVLMRLESMDIWVIVLGGSIYLAVLISLFDGLKDKPLQASAGVLSLGLGTGISAILGASALYGQLAISMGAAAGAILCVLFFSTLFSFDVFYSKLKTGFLLTYPAALLLGLLGLATLLFADLPWFALVFLVLIPLAARVPVPRVFADWQGIIFLSFIVLLPAVGAIFSVWYMADESPY